MSAAQNIVGRRSELETLERVFASRKSEFTILFGRRRVGKTFLVNQKFAEHFTFRVTGLGRATMAQQLNNFHSTLAATDPIFATEPVPTNWFAAFQMLIRLATNDKNARKVIFFR